MMSPASPACLDGYRLLRCIGRGGMGEVHLARDEALDRPVAIKLIASAKPTEAARRRFLNEARAIARVSHPNVVEIYRIGEVDGLPYIAYELVNGDSLDRRPLPVPWRMAVALGLGMAAGLAACHAQSVLHRDLKPGNVVVTKDNRVKLIDFGLALMWEEQGRETPPSMLSHPEAVLEDGYRTAPLDERPGGSSRWGTAPYVAPEVRAGHAASSASDVYALGTVLLELCTGVPPRAVHAPSETTRPAAPPSRPDVPRALADIIDRCVHPDPRERFRSGEEVRAALDRLAVAYPTVRPSMRPPGSGDPEEARVIASLARLAPRIDSVVERFYVLLFERHPHLRSLFPAELRGQRLKLASTLQLAVEGLGDPERTRSLLESLGRTHREYGVRPEQIDLVAPILIEALAEHDRAHWDDALRRAWEAAYTRMADAMRAGMR